MIKKYATYFPSMVYFHTLSRVSSYKFCTSQIKNATEFDIFDNSKFKQILCTIEIGINKCKMNKIVTQEQCTIITSNMFIEMN